MTEREELLIRVKKFETKYCKVIIEWLELVKEQKRAFCWMPKRTDKNEYSWALYEESNRRGNALKKFEQSVDLNILRTYIKYHWEDTWRYAWSFNPTEPDIDLTFEKDPQLKLEFD